MEIKEFVDKIKKLNIVNCEDCPFWIKNKFETDCKLNSSICINNENSDIDDILIIEEYLKEKEHEI